MIKVHRRILTIFLLCLSTTFLALAKPKESHNLKAWLSPTGATEDAWGKAKYKVGKKFSSLKIVTHGLTPGDYSVTVGGTEIGTFAVQVSSATGDELGKFVIDSRSADAVSIDPRGDSIQVVNEGTGAVELEVVRFPTTKGEAKQKTEIEASFVATSLAPGAHGKADLESSHGRTQFEVEVSGLPAGTYDLLVGGVVKGQIIVGADGLGEIEFDSLPDEIGDDDDGEDGNDDEGDDNEGDDDDEEDEDLLLTFDPRGQSISVSQGGNAFLTIDVFPSE